MVVLAALQFRDEVGRGLRLGDDGALEPSDPCLECVAAVEEHDVVTLRDELVDLVWRQMRSTTDDAVVVDLDLLRATEGDDLRAHLHFEPREVLAGAFGPLEVDVLELGEFACRADVFLDRLQGSADGAVDAVGGNEDAPGQSPPFTQLALPEPDRLGVGDRRELVEEEDLWFDDHVVDDRFLSVRR